ncbi:MAG TPA: rhodanese-like domain-containing protein [Polyangiaceae bacterium]|jgi:3-mercaptopyruvate sulfurtransferase SseA
MVSKSTQLALSFLVAAAFVLAGVMGCSRASSPSAELHALTVDEVAARIAANDGKTFVYDNNPRDRYAKSHVPGAHWLDYDRVTAADLPADKGATLVFYCASEL